jgi:hypothetical protein
MPCIEKVKKVTYYGEAEISRAHVQSTNVVVVQLASTSTASGYSFRVAIRILDFKFIRSVALCHS